MPLLSFLPEWLIEFLQAFWPSLVSGMTIEGAKTIKDKRLRKNALVPVDAESLKGMIDSLRHELSLESDTSNREMAKQVSPLIMDLKVITAHEMLATLRENTHSSNLHTLSVIDNLMGCCSRFVDCSLAAEEYERAYREMIGASRNERMILADHVFSLCVQCKKDDALFYAKGLRSYDPKNIWGLIPQLAYADNFDAALAQMPEIVRNNPTFLYYSTLFKEDRKETLGVDIDSYKVSMPEDLTYENIPQWLFGFSVLITRFLREWDERLFSDEIEPGPACKEFHDHVCDFLNLRETTELPVLNPDIELFSLVTDYIIYGNRSCLDEIIKVECTEQMVPFRYLAYATFFEKAGFVEEAKEYMAREKVLCDSRSFAYRFYLAYITHDAGYAVQALKQLVTQQVRMPSSYLEYLLILICGDAASYKEYFDSIPIINDIDARVFRELCSAFNDEKFDIDYLRDNVEKASPSLQPFIAMALYCEDDLQAAIDIFDKYANPRGSGVTAVMYFTLLKEINEYARLDLFLKERRAG